MSPSFKDGIMSIVRLTRTYSNASDIPLGIRPGCQATGDNGGSITSRGQFKQDVNNWKSCVLGILEELHGYFFYVRIGDRTRPNVSLHQLNEIY